MEWMQAPVSPSVKCHLNQKIQYDAASDVSLPPPFLGVDLARPGQVPGAGKDGGEWGLVIVVFIYLFIFLVVFIFPLVKEQSHCLWAVSSALLLSWYYIRLPEMPKLMWNCQAFLWLWPQPSAVSFSSRLPSLWPRWCHHHHPCPECELIRASGPDVTQRLCWLSFFFSSFHEANRVFCGI